MLARGEPDLDVALAEAEAIDRLPVERFAELAVGYALARRRMKRSKVVTAPKLIACRLHRRDVDRTR